MIAPQPQRAQNTFARKPDRADLVLGGELDHDIGDHRMHVEIQMAVNMIKSSDKFEMLFDLRANFRGQTAAHLSVEKPSHAGPLRILRKTARGIDHTDKFVRRQNAASPAHDDVQADVKARILAC